MPVEETIEKITFDSNSHAEWKFTLFMNLIICSISNMYFKFDHEITLVKTILNSVQSIKIYLKQKSLSHYLPGGSLMLQLNSITFSGKILK